MTKHYRQGDVLLREIKTIPADAVAVKREAIGEAGRVTLAHGERTGHAHALRALSVTGFKKHDSEYDAMQGFNDFILVGGSGAALNHEHVSGIKAEHDAIDLPPGSYEVLQQVEYSPAELIRVAD